MGLDLGETWNFIEVFLHLSTIFSPSSALDFLCNRDKLRDNFEHNSNAYYYYYCYCYCLNEPDDVFGVHVLIRHVSDETSSIVSCTESNEVVQ